MSTSFKLEIYWDSSWVDETAYALRVEVRAGFAGNEQPVAERGTCRIVLDNSTQRFSPGYTGGALYGDLVPRREVKVTATDGVSTWTLFRGYVKRIVPDAGELGGNECLLECEDGLAILGQQRISVVREDSKAVDEAVSAVVSESYTPPSSSYGDNADTLSHYGHSWQPENTTAEQALRDICDAVYGRFYIARDGTATFITRDDRLDSSGVADFVLGEQYWSRLRDVELANLLGLWRLNEESGSDAAVSSGNDYDGTYTGVTLGTLTGPDGNYAGSFDGLNDYVNLDSSGVLAVFGGAAGTMLVWFKVADSGVWTDGSNRYCFYFRVDSNNYAFVYKYTSSNQFRFAYKAGGTLEQVVKYGVSDTDWVCVALTWDKSADEMKAYWNGVQEGSTQTGLGTWAGTPAYGRVGSNLFGTSNWEGGIALCALWDKALDADTIASLASV